MLKNSKALLNIIIMVFCFSAQGAFSNKSSDWKLVIYMQADNDLYEYALRDLKELEISLKSSKRAVAYVFIDTPGNNGKKILSISQYGTEVLASIDEETSQVSNLRLLLNISSKHKAKSLFTFWGHGEGWSTTSAQFGGIALDYYPLNKLTIPDIAKVLKEFKKIDILAMDACLMQTVEVLYELKDYASYISGSTQVQSYNGFSYNQIVEYIENELILETQQSSSGESYYLAKQIVNINNEFSDDNKRTISVINTKEFENILIPSINKTFKLLSTFFENNLQYKILFNLQIIPAFLGESKDLNLTTSYIIKFLADINVDVTLLNKFKALNKAIGKSILNYRYGISYVENRDYHLGEFKALGIWVPDSKHLYNSRISEFKKSKFYINSPGWSSFLDSIYGTKIILFSH
jgi:hypothetical protein